jgi:hypothetical protein
MELTSFFQPRHSIRGQESVCRQYPSSAHCPGKSDGETSRLKTAQGTSTAFFGVARNTPSLASSIVCKEFALAHTHDVNNLQGT